MIWVMWKREETPFKTDCFKWPAVSSGAALYPGLKLTPFVLHSFFNPYTLPATSNASSWRRCFDQDMTGKVCYRELLPLLLISYSRCVAPAQMKAAVVSDREWPWPATPPLLLSISPPPTSYHSLPLSISLSIFITFRWSKNWSCLR